MGKRKKVGRSVKAAREGQPTNDDEAYKGAPHTLVIHRGAVGQNVLSLVKDFRRVMEPFTASKLKVRKKNVVKDFVSVAGIFSISHVLCFTKTEKAVYLRMLRTPRGPTMTFKVHNYSLSKDVLSTLRRHNMEAKQFLHHPLLVMNNFTGEGMHIKLMATMFQNMFPSINVNKVKLNDIRRCVLVNYNADTKTLDFRHYHIKAVPVGMSKGVKKLIKARVPNMTNYEDVSEFLLRGGNMSDSEAELDGPHNEVVLPQEMASRGNIKSATSAIRLTEIGPRMTLQLIKIEDGVGQGSVLFHEFVTKTEEELVIQNKMREKKQKIKKQRKDRQEMNVRNKANKKEQHKEKSLAGMKKKEEEESGTEDEAGIPSDDSIDDAEYYKQEVGRNPEPELFPKQNKGLKRKKTVQDKPFLPYKKKKANSEMERKDSRKKTSTMDDKKGFKDRKMSKHPKYANKNQDTFGKKETNKKNKLGSRVSKGKRLGGKKKPRRRNN